MGKVGTRVFYDKNTGQVLSILHRVDGGIVRTPIGELAYLDMDYDEFDPSKFDIRDVTGGKPTLISTYQETAEEKRIRELEDALLLQAENDIGGIL